jgi:hypothetical protein
MTLNVRSISSFGLMCLVVMWLVWGLRNAPQAQAKDIADPAVERARLQVKMLDDIYKTVIVGITDKYVHKEDDPPAITLAMSLFAAMKSKGWHETRLIDATGHPYDIKNVAKDDFEKAAVAALVSGKDYYEQVIKVDGKPRLRAATAVPVVMKKCTMCHENYKNVKQGVPIGALTYDVPVN